MAKVKYMTVSASAITRGSGHKALAAAAYRSGSRLVDLKYDCVHNYEAKRDVLHSEIALPANAPDFMKDRAQLWNAVESKEDTHNRRASAQLAKELLCILPRELEDEQQKDAMREWVRRLTERGLVVDWSLHKATASDGLANSHAHCMVATRSVDAQERYGFGKKWAGDPSIETGGRSKSPLDDDKTLRRFKEEYTAIINQHLEAAGSDTRITHLSNEARGMEAVPGVHKGKHACALEKKGVEIRLAAHNRKIGCNNFMQKYEQTATTSPHGWLLPPVVEKEDWHKRFAEWQLLRGGSMAARDATQQGQTVGAPPQTRSESRTDQARQMALLAYKQTQSFQERTNPGPEDSQHRR